jgi:hypothetical protein
VKHEADGPLVNLRKYYYSIFCLLRNRNRKDKTEDKEEVDDAVCWGWKQEIAEGVRRRSVTPHVPNH